MRDGVRETDVSQGDRIAATSHPGASYTSLYRVSPRAVKPRWGGYVAP